MLERLKNSLALTVTEQRVILFLAVTFLIGGGIRLYQETVPPRQQIDYRAADSTFAALSEALNADTLGQQAPTAGQPLNLNTASKNELISLPGVGEVIAERIILFREDEGPFRSVEDLRKIKGISTRKLQQLKPLVTTR
ncbi:MAG: ComEA family DNA-binding protein [Ignavibacteria bacterium]|nr:ComEA family DNA-binding protein [Ignavibacteria bacterium]